MGASDYSVLLRARLDTSQVAKDVLSVQAELNKVILSVGSKESSSKIKLIDAQAELKSLDEIKSRISELSGKNVQTTEVKGNLGEVTGQIIKYRDEKGKLVTETYKLKAATDEENAGFSQTTKVVQGSTTAVKTWTDGIGNAISRTLQYATSVGLVYGALNQLKQGLQYIKDLNKEMVSIQMVTGGTDSEISSLANGYNNLAKEMGTTTLEVAKGSLEFVRQGKTAEETGILIKNSTMMSKLGNMEAADSSEALTSIMNGFKMEVSDTGDAVSKLVAIDNVAATSVKELSTAMRYSSNSAKQVGVDFDHLAAYIGTVSSVTRLSEETIGQAFKTIFARMTSIKNLKAFDEEGQAVNKVESSLSRVGINLRDNNGHFRDMQDVLGDIGKNWNNINKEDQLYIAEQIAGVRQKETFLVLMNNQLEMQKQLTAETKSAGLAEERYAIYLQGVEAAQNRMTASWEKLVQGAVTGGLVSGFYDLAAGIMNTIDAIGGLKTIILLASAAWVTYAVSQSAAGLSGIISTIEFVVSGLVGVTSATEAMTAAQWLLNIAMDANPVGVIIAGFTLLAGVIWGLSSAIETAAEKEARLNDEFNESAKVVEEQRKKLKSIKDLTAEYQKLKDNKSGEKLTADQEQRLLDIQNQMKDLLPTLSGHYDDYGNFLFDATTNLKALTDAQDENVKSTQKASQAALDAQAKERARLLLEANDLKNKSTGGSIDRYTGKKVSDTKNEDWKKALEDEKASFTKMGDEGKNAFIAALQASGDDGKKLAEDIFIPMMSKAKEIVDANQPEIKPEIDMEAAKKAYEDGIAELLKTTIEMIKQKKNAEKDALQEQLRLLKENDDAQKTYYKYQLDEIKKVSDEKKKALEREAEEQKRNYELQKKAVEEQLAAYEKIIDNQKESLKLQEKEDAYNDAKAEKQKNLSDLQDQIAELSLDTSAEGIAKRMELEAQASKLVEELSKDERDRTYELQNDALDAEKQKAEDEAKLQLSAMEKAQEQADYENKLRQQALDDEQEKAQQRYEIIVKGLDDQTAAQEEALRKQIAAVDDYLKQEGTIRNDAMAMIEDKNSNLYSQLLDWNKKYGTGINDDITSMWKTAMDAVKEYADAINSIPNTRQLFNQGESDSLSNSNNIVLETDDGNRATLGMHHSGIDSGFVGGNSRLKSNEEFAKLIKGEIVVNPEQMDNFMKKVLPETMSSNPKTENNGIKGLEVGNLMNIVVNGSLDSSVLPDIEKISQKVMGEINKIMLGRGISRRADAFGQ